jgi:hypothetical protein
MFTPDISVEIAKSDCVTCRAQPPSWMRFGERLNDAQNCGMPPTSVGGGLRNAGMFLASAGSCGPGSTSALGLVTLTAPCDGSSGFPNDAAFATVAAAAAAVATPPAAVAARILRRDIAFTFMVFLTGAPARDRSRKALSSQALACSKQALPPSVGTNVGANLKTIGTWEI